MTIAISVEDVSKYYRLGVISSLTLSGDLNRWWALARGKPDPLLMVDQKDHGDRHGDSIWALKSVNFQVLQGEAIGIIGRNGAGKSTLLKILSRVTAPTSGVVKIRGRIASLLEVGTGFHPELTGRENIYLNGTILGMTRSEIDRKMDEIIDFSGIEQFIDTPVKRYSSGMYVRLAFAVAAHLEPEILVVDEVLAVGDASFQKKCLGKMGDVAGEGRTVLFVSHNMAAVSSLCTKGIVLDGGQMVTPMGTINNAIENYLSRLSETTTINLEERKDRKGDGQICMTGFDVLDEQRQVQDIVLSGQTVEFRICYKCVNNLHPRNISVAIGVNGIGGGVVTVLSNELASARFDEIPQRGCIRCVIPRLPFSAGQYSLNLIIRQNDFIQDWIQEAAILHVESGDFFRTGRIPPSSHGGVLIDQVWEVEK